MQIENSQDKYLLLEPFVAPLCSLHITIPCITHSTSNKWTLCSCNMQFHLKRKTEISEVKNQIHFLNCYTLKQVKNHHIVDISLHYVNLQLKQPLRLYHITFSCKTAFFTKTQLIFTIYSIFWWSTLCNPYHPLPNEQIHLRHPLKGLGIETYTYVWDLWLKPFKGGYSWTWRVVNN
jgi:hypothetical protein